MSALRELASQAGRSLGHGSALMQWVELVNSRLEAMEERRAAPAGPDRFVTVKQLMRCLTAPSIEELEKIFAELGIDVTTLGGRAVQLPGRVEHVGGRVESFEGVSGKRYDVDPDKPHPND